MKPKVLLLPTYFPTVKYPVIGSQIKEQTELLNEDIEFRVLYCLPGMGWRRFLLFLFIRIFSRRRVYQSCYKALAPGTLKADGVYYFSHRFLPHRIQVRLRVDAYAFLIDNYIRQGWKPELIHARTAEYAGVHAAYLAKKFHLPWILTENCIFILDKKINTLKIKQYRFAIESANKVAVVSNYLKSWLLTNHFNCNVVTVGNWINENKFYPFDSKDQSNVFTILTVGHTGFTKDWPTFFLAIKKLLYEKKATKFKVKIAVTQIFDDISKNYIPSLVHSHGLQDTCEIFNELSRDNIVSFFQNGDVFVSTSINETFGIASAEAMMCGIPVVATDNGGINDFISKDNGIKVHIQDADAIAEALFKIMNREIHFDKNHIRESVLNKFGTMIFKKNMIDLYKGIIEQELK